MEIIKNLDDLKTYVFDFLSKLSKKDVATIIALSGDLGVGKTAFVKMAAKYFSINEDITSPTFVIQKEYAIKNHFDFDIMIHIDAYRLKNKSELEYLKWNDLITDPKKIIFIEWPEQVKDIDMPNAYSVHIDIAEDESRSIILQKTP